MIENLLPWKFFKAQSVLMCFRSDSGKRRKAGDDRDERPVKRGENFNEMRVFREGRDEIVCSQTTGAQTCHRLFGGMSDDRSATHTHPLCIT